MSPHRSLKGENKHVWPAGVGPDGPGLQLSARLLLWRQDRPNDLCTKQYESLFNNTLVRKFMKLTTEARSQGHSPWQIVHSEGVWIHGCRTDSGSELSSVDTEHMELYGVFMRGRRGRGGKQDLIPTSHQNFQKNGQKVS